MGPTLVFIVTIVLMAVFVTLLIRSGTQADRRRAPTDSPPDSVATEDPETSTEPNQDPGSDER